MGRAESPASSRRLLWNLTESKLGRSKRRGANVLGSDFWGRKGERWRRRRRKSRFFSISFRKVKELLRVSTADEIGDWSFGPSLLALYCNRSLGLWQKSSGSVHFCGKNLRVKPPSAIERESEKWTDFFRFLPSDSIPLSSERNI